MPLSSSSPRVEPLVLVEEHGSARVLRLNRPDKLNALSTALLVALAERLAALDGDEAVRAVVLTGAGRAFSAGGDRGLLEGHLAGTMADDELVRRAHDEITGRLVGIDVPVIAAVNGPAVGMAVEFVALCDLVVMAEDAYLWENHATFGLGPTVAHVWPLVLPPVVAKELLMTARRVAAPDALRLGLANRVVPPGDEVTVALELAHEIASLPRSGPAAVKRGFNAWFGRPGSDRPA